MMRRALVLVLTVSAAIGACTSAPKPRGQLMVVIDTDMAPGVDFDRLEIDIKVDGQTVHSDVYRELGFPGLRQFPLTYAVISNDNPQTQVQMRVSTGRSADGNATLVGKPTTLNELVATVPTDRIAVLRMPVQWLCIGSARVLGDYVEGNCAEGTTCLAGECVPWDVDSKTLVTFDERKVFGGGSAQGEGACFDTVGCFSSGHAASVDLATCTIEAPKDDLGVNVALVARRGEGGICGPDACLVPLDGESAIGWQRTPEGRIQLPKAVCKSVLATRATGVVVTTACAQKSEELPTCGPWSVIKQPGTFDAGGPTGAVGDADVLDAGGD